MKANQIIEAVNKAKSKSGFVVTWWITPGADPKGFTMPASSVVKNASAYEARLSSGVTTIAFTTPDAPLRRNELPEQLATYLALQEEKVGMHEDNDLDEQFWRRDA